MAWRGSVARWERRQERGACLPSEDKRHVNDVEVNMKAK